MGLFDSILKKGKCGLCGADISAFNSTSLSDARICKSCKKKLSPYYVFTKNTGTLNSVKEHLAYRQRNAEQTRSFIVNHAISMYGKTLYIDKTHGWFCISKGIPSPASNPDLFSLHWLTACEVNTEESKFEQYEYKDNRQVSYSPPRYNYSLRIRMVFYLKDCPLVSRFSEVFANKFSSSSTSRPSSFDSVRADAEKARTLLLSLRDQAVQLPPPKTTVECPFCGAPTIPDDQNRCEYCMSTLK